MIMYEIIVFTHGLLGRELVSTAGLILGEHDEIKVFAVMPGCDLGQLKSQVSEAIRIQAEKSKNVLVLTDLLYGTPFNMVSSLRETYDFRHITGTNLTMLMEAINRKESTTETLDDALPEILNTTREGIISVDDLFS